MTASGIPPTPTPLAPAEVIARLESLLGFNTPEALHTQLRQIVRLLQARGLTGVFRERRVASRTPPPATTRLPVPPRRRAADALRETEARLDWVLGAIGVGLWFNTLPLERLNWDAQTRRLFFIPPGVEPTMALFWSRLHPQDRRRTRAAITAALGDGQRYQIDHRAVDPTSGAIRWIRSAGQATRDAQGRAVRFDGINYDITEYKQGEQEIARLNQALQCRVTELQTILDTTPIGLAIADDPEGRHIYGNPINEQLLGLPAGSELSHAAPLPAPYRVFQDGTELGLEALPMQQAIRGKTVSGQVIEVERPDGKRITLYCNAAPLPGERGCARGAVGAFLDITQIKETEAALRLSEERYRGLFEQAADGIFVSDQRGRYLDVNTMGAAMLGYTRDELLTLRIADVLVAQDAPRLAGEMAKLERADVSLSEWQFRRKDGSVFPGEVRGRQLPDGSLQGILRDISERKCHEARLAEQAEQLREADRRKDEFLAMLAHELRNPLAPIVNAVQILKSSGLTDARFTWCRDLIDRQTDHLKRLVDDLLDISRIARGTVEIAPAPVELEDIVQRAVEAARPLIESRRHRLSIQLPPQPVQVTGDLVRLAQVVANLLDNAAKYTAPGGQIRLAAERAGSAVTIRVRDTGRGIAPTVLPHLFELFYQAERTLDRTEGGLGIGLSLVKRLVDLHGGTVEAFSDGLGQGSEFVVCLPRRVDSGSSARAAAPAPDAPAADQVRLLVVDDNRDAADSLAMLLHGDGCAVTVAYDGETALGLVLAQRPQLVLLDLGLPGMDGFAVAQTIRNRSTGPRIRLVALTGYGQPTDRERSRAAGFDAHLVKPVDVETLHRLLAEVRASADHPPYPPAEPAPHAGPAPPALPPPGADALMPCAEALSAPPPTRLAQCAGRHTAGALISVLPHELSQPLAAIAMYSNATIALIHSGQLAPDALADVMARIETQVKRAVEILTRLREFVRPDRAAPPSTDLCQTLADVVALIRPFATHQQVQLCVDFPAQPVTLEAGKSAVGQVVLNLLFNSIEAIAQAGSAQRRVCLSVHPEPMAVRVTVQDSGPGISPDTAERVFQPFASDKPGGCGLGLAISRSLIEPLGGRLWVDPQGSDGATLHVRLPRSADTQADH